MSTATDSCLEPVSLSGFRAHRRVRRYRALPTCLRTPARTALVVDAIFAYALEPRFTQNPAPERECRRRLEEFLPPAGPHRRWGLLRWLADNQVDEGRQSPAGLRALLLVGAGAALGLAGRTGVGRGARVDAAAGEGQGEREEEGEVSMT